WATTLAGTSASTTTHASPGVRARSPATDALIPQAPASANPRAGASAPSIVPRTVCGGARGTECLLHNPPHVRQQLLRIVHDAILDGVLHAANTASGPVRKQPNGTGAVQYLEVRKVVLLHHNKVCQRTHTNCTELRSLALGLHQYLG